MTKKQVPALLLSLNFQQDIRIEQLVRDHSMSHAGFFISLLNQIAKAHLNDFVIVLHSDAAIERFCASMIDTTRQELEELIDICVKLELIEGTINRFSARTFVNEQTVIMIDKETELDEVFTHVAIERKDNQLQINQTHESL